MESTSSQISPLSRGQTHAVRSEQTGAGKPGSESSKGKRAARPKQSTSSSVEENLAANDTPPLPSVGSRQNPPPPPDTPYPYDKAPASTFNTGAGSIESPGADPLAESLRHHRAAPSDQRRDDPHYRDDPQRRAEDEWNSTTFLNQHRNYSRLPAYSYMADHQEWQRRQEQFFQTMQAQQAALFRSIQGARAAAPPLPAQQPQQQYRDYSFAAEQPPIE